MCSNVIESKLVQLPSCSTLYGICYMHNKILEDALWKHTFLNPEYITKIVHKTDFVEGIYYVMYFIGGLIIKGLVPIEVLDARKIY